MVPVAGITGSTLQHHYGAGITCPPPCAPCTAQLPPLIPRNQNPPSVYPLRLLINVPVHVRVGDNLLVEFDAPCINLLVIFHNVTSRLIFQPATSQML